jgi:hypothetical protein
MCTSRFDEIFERCLSEGTEPDCLEDLLDFQPPMFPDSTPDHVFYFLGELDFQPPMLQDNEMEDSDQPQSNQASGCDVSYHSDSTIPSGCA